MSLCQNMCLPQGEDMTAEDADSMVVAWIKKRAAEHKTFALREQFLLLHDLPAYMTFRTALRTGDFMLWLGALRRIAPIFYISGKDRYQYLKVMAELFSVSLSKDACARLGLDERQEVANRVYKTLTKRILPSFIHKLAPTAVLREIAEFEFGREFLEGPLQCLRASPSFEGDIGKGKVVALDGRVFPEGKWQDILGAPATASEKMREFILYFVKKDKTKKGATKNKIFSIPALITENKSTRSKGRSSKLKDTVGNACAGGQEMKAVVLNIWDMVEGGGSLSEEQVVGMVTRVGASTPFSMANATGGAKHANKSAGPTKWLQDHSSDAVADEPFFTVHAHGVGLPVSIHQGVRQRDLEGGAEGGINYYVSELDSRWQMGTDLLLSWLRDNQKAARDGIAAHLATDILDDKRWTGDCTPNGVVAFYVVGGEAGLRTSDVAHPAVSSGGGIQGGPATSPEILAPVGSVENSTVRSGGDGTEEGGVPTVAEEDPLLHYRRGADRSVQRERGPNIGEAELSLVHFIVWAKKYCGRNFENWLVTSVDTDQWMIILLAMSTGFLKASGEGAVEVTVHEVVGGDPKYTWVNRVFAVISGLRDGNESAWPTTDSGFQGWIPDDDEKVRLFVLVYLLAGCDFLPATTGLPFGNMWALALKSVRTEGVFRTSIFVREGGVWGVKIDECISCWRPYSIVSMKLSSLVVDRSPAGFPVWSTAMSHIASTSSGCLSSGVVQ
ncbi:unnamed protein product [Ectocarpus sp. CCAP 1310/34]|nr:unnamed protein product [Ectocarpus sp. CCAP 1310/34]